MENPLVNIVVYLPWIIMADQISEQTILDLINGLNRLVRTMEGERSGSTRAGVGVGNNSKDNSGLSNLQKAIDATGKVLRKSAVGVSSSTKDSSDTVKAGGKALSTAMRSGGRGIQQYSKEISTAFGGVGKAATDLTKALYKGTQGASIYATATESAVDSVANFAMIIGGPVGIVLGGLTKALTSAMVIATKQADAQFVSYQALQKFGGATAGGVDDILKMSQALNIGSEELEKLNGLVSANSASLSMFRGSVGEGAKSLANISQDLTDSGFRDKFIRLGLTVDEQNESTAYYLQLQTRLGATQNKSTRELASSVASYVEEQDKLTKLTGASRKTQEAAQERQMAVEQFRFKLMEMREKNQTAEATELENRFKALGSMKGGEELQVALASTVTGFITKAGAPAYLALGGALSEFTSDFSITTEQALEKLGIKVTENTGLNSTFGNLALTAGQGSEALGINIIALQEFAVATRDASKRAEAIAKTTVQQDEGSVSNTTKNLAGIASATIDTRKQLEQLVQTGVPLAVGAMSKLADAANLAATKLNKISGGQAGIDKNLSDSSAIKQGARFDIYSGEVEKAGEEFNSFSGFVSKLKGNLTKLFGLKEDSVDTGPAFGRDDQGLTLQEKSATTLTQIKDLMSESMGLEVPTWKFGGGGGGVGYAGGGGGVGYAGGDATAPAMKMEGLGRVAAQFESGGNAGTISSGHGDYGGKSYGAFQLSSKTGDLEKFLEKSGYASKFQGMQTGSKQFDEQWKALAQSDKGFGQAQQSHAKMTHFDPQMEKLKKSGIDLSSRGSGVQEAVMSTANQYGANTSVITKALAGKDTNKISDKEIIDAIQDYKAANVKQNFRSSSSAVQAGVAKRIESERLALYQAGTADKSVATQVATLGTDKKERTTGIGSLIGQEQINNISSLLAPTLQSVAKMAAPNLPMMPGTGPALNSITGGAPNTNVADNGGMSQILDKLSNMVDTSQGGDRGSVELLQQLVSLQRDQNASMIKLIQSSTA